jgi:hypothetical protein
VDASGTSTWGTKGALWGTPGYAGCSMGYSRVLRVLYGVLQGTQEVLAEALQPSTGTWGTKGALWGTPGYAGGTRGSPTALRRRWTALRALVRLCDGAADGAAGTRGAPTAATSAPGLRSPAPCLHRDLTVATQGLRSPRPHRRRDWAHPCPHPHRDCARLDRICAGAGLTPAHICSSDACGSRAPAGMCLRGVHCDGSARLGTHAHTHACTHTRAHAHARTTAGWAEPAAVRRNRRCAEPIERRACAALRCAAQCRAAEHQARRRRPPGQPRHGRARAGQCH